ncbi:MAG: tRNA (guanosine(46)-N7)-methyltransferase TrmB [Chlamydiia bacterium]|nr:tRNA (guanosine(46)-N7)-methyltransferase TrmB [Chlamydiia bacterium]
MKPDDLKSPFTWDERRVCYEDRVLYVPEHYDKVSEFKFPGWSGLFGSDKPLMVEYCSGNGHWIVERAKNFPQFNWIAIEKKFVRVRKIWSKLKNEGLDNLIAVCGEGKKVSAHFFSHGTVAEAFINFPDPWPKKRHIKNRIIQPPFVSELYRILGDDGKVNLVTDDPDYSNWMIAVMQGHTGFKSDFPAPFYQVDQDGYGSSWFDELWRSKGKQIRYHSFSKL